MVEYFIISLIVIYICYMFYLLFKTRSELIQSEKLLLSIKEDVIQFEKLSAKIKIWKLLKHETMNTDILTVTLKFKTYHDLEEFMKITDGVSPLFNKKE